MITGMSVLYFIHPHKVLYSIAFLTIARKNFKFMFWAMKI